MFYTARETQKENDKKKKKKKPMGENSCKLWDQDSDVKNWLLGKDPDSGRDWGQEEKRVTEDEVVGWHPWLNGHEFGQAQGDTEGQRSLVYCSQRGLKELDTTAQLNNKNMHITTQNI